MLALASPSRDFAPPQELVRKWVGPRPILPLEPGREHLALALLVRGRAEHRSGTGGPARVVPSRTLIWRFPQSQGTLQTVTEGSVAWAAAFDSEVLDLVHRDSLPVPDRRGGDFVGLEASALDRLVAVFERALETLGDPDRLRVVLTHLLVSACIEQQLACSTVHPAVRRATRILRSRSRRVVLDTLARKCEVSDSWLSRLFRLHMGMSLVEYRNHYRLGRFLEQHVFGNDRSANVMEAAAKAGFGSYAQFHRICRQRFGCAPSQLLGPAPRPIFSSVL